MPILPSEDIASLHGAVLSAGLADSRTTLLAGLDPAFVARLPTDDIPANQVSLDLHALNEAGRLKGGAVPLEIWLQNALLVTSGREEEPVFRDALARTREAAAGLAPSTGLTPSTGADSPSTGADSLSTGPDSPSPPTRRLPLFLGAGVLAAAVVALVVWLAVPSRFVVSVLDHEGSPLPGARVTLPGVEEVTVETDAQGEAHFRTRARNAGVRVQHERYTPFTGTLPSGAPVHLCFRAVSAFITPPSPPVISILGPPCCPRRRGRRGPPSWTLTLDDTTRREQGLDSPSVLIDGDLRTFTPLFTTATTPRKWAMQATRTDTSESLPPALVDRAASPRRRPHQVRAQGRRPPGHPRRAPRRHRVRSRLSRRRLQHPTLSQARPERMERARITSHSLPCPRNAPGRRFPRRPRLFTAEPASLHRGARVPFTAESASLHRGARSPLHRGISVPSPRNQRGVPAGHALPAQIP
ncbi:MAG: hypothetical protein R3B70_30135 [Polyangiaceae bacterium]